MAVSLDNFPELQSLFVGRTSDLISIVSGVRSLLQATVTGQELSPRTMHISETRLSGNIVL
jgi:hypothetical protein